MNIIPKYIEVNHRKGRKRKVDMIVIHIMEGTMAGTGDWFNNPNAQVSAHYGVPRREDEDVVQYVRDEDTAWANGRVKNPTAPLVLERPNINPNDYSISIENEGYCSQFPTPIQIIRNVEIIQLISKKYDFPINRRHVVGHHEIYSDKPCPCLINVDDLVAIAKSRDGFSAISARTLKRGDRGSEVELLQTLLVRLGDMSQKEMNTGPGIFGPRTEKAFRSFIQRHKEV